MGVAVLGCGRRSWLLTGMGSHAASVRGFRGDRPSTQLPIAALRSAAWVRISTSLFLSLCTYAFDIHPLFLISRTVLGPQDLPTPPTPSRFRLLFASSLLCPFPQSTPHVLTTSCLSRFLSLETCLLQAACHREPYTLPHCSFHQHAILSHAVRYSD